MRTFSTLLLGLMLGGCVAEAGEACDGFFTNQCPRMFCENTSMEPVEVTLEGGAAMGCHCLPKAAN